MESKSFEIYPFERFVVIRIDRIGSERNEGIEVIIEFKKDFVHLVGVGNPCNAINKHSKKQKHR